MFRFFSLFLFKEGGPKFHLLIFKIETLHHVVVNAFDRLKITIWHILSIIQINKAMINLKKNYYLSIMLIQYSITKYKSFLYLGGYFSTIDQKIIHIPGKK